MFVCESAICVLYVDGKLMIRAHCKGKHVLQVLIHARGANHRSLTWALNVILRSLKEVVCIGPREVERKVDCKFKMTPAAMPHAEKSHGHIFKDSYKAMHKLLLPLCKP